jgi:tetratricopeptide (TPR) repeat protein
MKRINLLTSLLLCIFSYTVHTQNTYALVIGLSKYKEITPLQFADRDALAFAECLKIQKIPESNIKVFINEEANRLNILDGLFNLTAKTKAKDRLYFYFGGHGDLEAQISYDNSLLLLYDCFKKNYFQGSEFISLSELKTWLGDLAKKQVEVIFIADACHSGGLVGGKDGISKTQSALNDDWAGITKILSCKSTEFSLEGKQWGGGRGLFSYHLVNGLTGRADANKDKKISLSELDNYLKINVLREANPNVQTPVVMGNNKQMLSVANTEGLEKLAELEQKNFALLTEVNTRGNDKKEIDDLAKLDTTIVETYKRFTKALKEKRIAMHDDSLDCALIHYKKLETYKLPENLYQMIKRNMAVGLMDLELNILKDVREKSKPNVSQSRKVISAAISNLQETMGIFDTSHYIHKYLMSRVLILKSQLSIGNLMNDKNPKSIEKNKLIVRDLLYEGLQLEPNMISTYSLLSTYYRVIKQPDSAIYFQEKIVKLIPNEGQAFISLGFNYSIIKYRDSLNRPAFHPKSYEYYKHAIALDSSIAMTSAYSMLGSLYMGQSTTTDGEWADKAHRQYALAIPYFEKLVQFYDITDEEILKLNLKNYFPKDSEAQSALRYKFFIYFKNSGSLQFLYNTTGNLAKFEENKNKMKHKVVTSGSFTANVSAAQNMFYQFDREQEDIHIQVALDYLIQALKIAEDTIKTASLEDKTYFSIQYRELLKSVGATYRALNNYSEAELYLKKALDYSIINLTDKEKFKLFRLNLLECKNSLISLPGLSSKKDTDYRYFIDANIELFFLELSKKNTQQAFNCLEKALKVSVTESGNYVSSKEFEEEVFKTYTNIDKQAFLALKQKYFPEQTKK